MNILHYSLGLSPYRSGGLPKYATDLMLEECIQGHKVGLIYPGGISIISKKSRIKEKRNFAAVAVFEILNSVPVPLLYGIKEPMSIIDESYIDTKDFGRLLDKLNPDIFHIHTFMGFPKDFLMVLKKRGIKIVMTTHDYYGICPKVNLINERGCLCPGPSPKRCAICNIVSPSTSFLRLRNLSMLSKFKRYKKWFPLSSANSNKPSAQKVETKPEVVLTAEMYDKYGRLDVHYKQMFAMVDVFHFNSKNTEKVFKKYINIPEGSQVIPITHSNVADFRKKRVYNHKILRLGFIGSEAPYKGLPILKSVINKLNIEGYGNQLHLDVYGGRVGVDEKCSNIHYKGRFRNAQMSMVYDSIDLLVIPSIWNETFGFTSIEALQFGVPVLVSCKVGAKDVIQQYAPKFIFDGEDELYKILLRLLNDRSELGKYNEMIVNSPWNWSLDRHSKEVVDNLYKNNNVFDFYNKL